MTAPTPISTPTAAAPAGAQTILVVDDDDAVLHSLRRTLSRGGYRIVTAADPRTVPELLDRERIDAVISDNDMPWVSGVELLGQIRRAHADVARILITGHATLDLALAAINDGAVHRMLTKPWDDRELCRILGEVLARQGELRRQAAADRAAERRARLLEAIEREHPGISVIARAEDGAYVVRDVDLGRIGL